MEFQWLLENYPCRMPITPDRDRLIAKRSLNSDVDASLVASAQSADDVGLISVRGDEERQRSTKPDEQLTRHS